MPRHDRRWPVTFRLYPAEDGRLFIRVNIWPTRRAMREQLRGYGLTRLHSTAGACTDLHVERLHGGRWRRLPLVAEINLAVRAIGTEVITHEILHATFAYARRRKLDITSVCDTDRGDLHCSPQEEWLCYAHGRMVRQFVNRAYKAGLYA